MQLHICRSVEARQSMHSGRFVLAGMWIPTHRKMGHFLKSPYYSKDGALSARGKKIIKGNP